MRRISKVRTWKASLLVAVATALCLAQTATEYESPEVMHVAGMLNCNCSCHLRMDCVMPPSGLCPVCKAARIHIANMKADGKSDKQILDQFVAENDASILAVSPGPWGNATPYIALAFGLAIVFLSIRYYRRVRPAPVVPAGDDAMLSRYHDQIEKDLSKLD
jgi:cytochrome c-type biogenesis protein CcmH/NrfF